MRMKSLSLLIAMALWPALALAQDPAAEPKPETDPAQAPAQQEADDALPSDDPDAASTEAAKVPLDEIRS